MGGGDGGWEGGLAYGEFVCGVDFNMKFDGLFVLAYGMSVRELDFNVEVDGFCGGLVHGVDFNVEVDGVFGVTYGGFGPWGRL